MINISSNLIMSYQQWSTDKFIRVFILTSIIFVTLIGNSYIIFELFCRSHRHRTRLHFFILHLAIGDLAVCFCTMTSELFLLIYDQEWILGNILCKLILYIQVVTIASTTFIHLAMTYDRYEAVCCPFRTCKSPSHIRRIIFICWLSSFLVAIPQLFIFEQSHFPGTSTKYRCASTGYTAEWQRRIYFTIFASYILIIPVFCMAIWYIKIIRIISTSTKNWSHDQPTTSSTKIRTVKLAMAIIIVFIVCWTPYMIVTLIEIYSNGRIRPPSWFDGVLQTICLNQSALNPLIYMTFNQKRKYSPALILAAASTYSQKLDRRERGLRREHGGSISLCSLAEPSFRNTIEEKSRKENLHN